MGEIGGFILSLMAAASASALIDGFVPDGGGMRKYLRYLIALVILLTLLSPLKKLVGSIPQMVEQGNFAYDSVEAMSRANAIAALHIGRAVREKFACDAAAEYDGSRIVIRVKAKAGLFASDIVRFVERSYGITAEVVTDE